MKHGSSKRAKKALRAEFVALVERYYTTESTSFRDPVMRRLRAQIKAAVRAMPKARICEYDRWYWVSRDTDDREISESVMHQIDRYRSASQDIECPDHRPSAGGGGILATIRSWFL